MAKNFLIPCTQFLSLTSHISGTLVTISEPIQICYYQLKYLVHSGFPSFNVKSFFFFLFQNLIQDVLFCSHIFLATLKISHLFLMFDDLNTFEKYWLDNL